MGCQQVVRLVNAETERRFDMVILLVMSILTVLLLPVIFPIRDEEVTGIVFQDPETLMWVVCLTDRTLPLTFVTEAEAKSFLQRSKTYPFGG